MSAIGFGNEAAGNDTNDTSPVSGIGTVSSNPGSVTHSESLPACGDVVADVLAAGWPDHGDRSRDASRECRGCPRRD